MTRFAIAALAAISAAACAPSGQDGAAAHQANALKAAVGSPAGNCGSQDCGGAAGGGSAQAVKVPIDGSPVLGSPAALVTLVEFTDYECPFCSRAHATVEKLTAEYGGKLRLVLKHNPLPMHPRATPAARAAIAAAASGKFWELHRALFAQARNLDDAGIDAAAREAGLDPAQLRAAVADPRLDETIKRDQALARTVGATGTPTFFVNGRRIQGAQPIEKFRAVIDEELAAAQKLVAAGTRPEEVYARLQEKAASAAPAEPQQVAPPPVAPASERVKVELGSAPIRGHERAPVTLLIFSDFQCPFCSRAAETVHAIGDKYGDRVRIAFRNLPLPMHHDARLAAAAAMAAHDQGKFWPFHDALFTHQQELDRAGLEKRAAELGLDLPRFREALDQGTSEAAVAADEAEAQRLGVRGTPTMFVNGRKIVGALPLEAISSVIDEELRR